MRARRTARRHAGGIINGASSFASSSSSSVIVLLLLFPPAAQQSSVYNLQQQRKLLPGFPFNPKAVRKRWKAVQVKHPFCFATKGLLNKTSFGPKNLGLDLSLTAEYWRMTPRNTKPQQRRPRYDHVSCFVMRARYNCALPPSLKQQLRNKPNPWPNETFASDWTLVLREKGFRNQPVVNNNKNNRCHLKQLIDDLGGVVGVAKQLLMQRRHAKHPRFSNKLTLVLQGPSHIRQVFQALTCTWQSQISALTLQIGGPRLTEAELNRRNGTLWKTTEQTGQLVDGSRLIEQGCHFATFEENRDIWYRKNVSLPPQFPHCHDDLAMVEFANLLRVYYLFRPERYESPREIYAKLNVTSEQVDGFISISPLWLQADNFDSGDYPIYNNVSQQQQQQYDPNVIRLLIPGISVYRQLQERDARYWHGANNPGVFVVPDGHACMPGVPDDEVNLFLFALLRGINIVA